jgi:hypothetical protein
MIFQTSTNTGLEAEMPRPQKKLNHSRYCACSKCKCNHAYSRSMEQPYPRLCVLCGEVEKNET